MSEFEGRKRKLTPFLAHEMLFDYATDHLDADRRQAVEEFIKDEKESQNLLEAIRNGIRYANTLQKIELSDECLHELNQSENFLSLSKRLARWSEWPDSMRWSIIALAVSACTAGIIVVIPWKSIPLFRAGPSGDSSWVEVARIDTKKGAGDEASGGTAEVADGGDSSQSGPLESSGDEEFAEEASGTASAPGAATVAAPPVAAPVVAPVHAPVAVKATPAPSIPADEGAATSAAVASSKASRGFVYRAFMTLTDLENLTPKITQQIKELGAEKAGEVELGWRRGSGRYYHFTMPSANEQKLLDALRAYGPVRISKDLHPRVMPEGQVRFILWIESGS